jgi:hypothetical protein
MHMRFGTVMAVYMFWGVTLYVLIDIYQRFGGDS